MTTYKIIKVTNEDTFDEKDLYNDIFDIINHNNKESLEEIIELTKGKINLDFSYEDGLFCALAIQRGNVEILKLLCEYDNTLISKHGIEMLVDAIMYGQTECVKYLIDDKKVNVDELKNTDAYNSFKKIESSIFDQHQQDFEPDQEQDSQAIGQASSHYIGEAY